MLSVHKMEAPPLPVRLQCGSPSSFLCSYKQMLLTCRTCSINFFFRLSGPFKMNFQNTLFLCKRRESWDASVASHISTGWTEPRIVHTWYVICVNRCISWLRVFVGCESNEKSHGTSQESHFPRITMSKYIVIRQLWHPGWVVVGEFDTNINTNKTQLLNYSTHNPSSGKNSL